ncbi:MAG TPA: FAD-dependent oxidoreductase [Chloroflexota bacterium]|nr:FAD-dependent oxidoreductase [Chloroflexota bacterium]
MRTLPPDEAIRTFDENILGYTPEEAQLEAARGAGLDFSAARAACPFGVDIERLVSLAAEGRLDEAVASVMEAHPWPGIMGRWCNLHCENAMREPGGPEPIGIKGIERAAADHSRARPAFREGALSGKSVAVIGAGSAASGAAYRLRQLGHEVHVYEQLPVTGGMMFVGFPNFRLPVKVLRQDINYDAWGVVFHGGVKVDEQVLASLMAKHDAVLVTTGKFKEERLGIPGEDLEGVLDALHYLANFKLGQAPPIGPRVVVIGAGYTAQDSSRTARRLGCEVQVLYRRSREEMPVHGPRRDFYIQRQADEGAPYVFQVAPVRVLGSPSGRVIGLECVHTQPGPPDASGRPSFVLGSDVFTVECDTVIAAVGEKPDTGWLPPEVLTADGRISVDEGYATCVPKLFAAGEVAGSSGTEWAFAAGLKAGLSIDRFLRAASS